MNDDKVVPDSSGVFADLMSTANQVHSRASIVKANLEKLERLLNNLPGKTTAVHYYNFEPAASADIWDAIRFHRSGKQWILSYGHGFDEDLSAPGWTPVMECALETKIEVLKQSRGILTAIVEAQRELLRKIDAANDEFTAWLTDAEASSGEAQ